jgi:hypothetical protein
MLQQIRSPADFFGQPGVNHNCSHRYAILCGEEYALSITGMVIDPQEVDRQSNSLSQSPMYIEQDRGCHRI